MKFKSTVVYETLEDFYSQGKTSIWAQGGTRSGKTYNILFWLISKASKEWTQIAAQTGEEFVIDIVRDTMTSLRISAMFDFFQILERLGWYIPQMHNKSQNTYKLGNCLFRFFGSDEDQKVRGPGRDVLFVNEINGMKKKTFQQLNQRTKRLLIADYNPADEECWVYDWIDEEKEESKGFFITTFRDNPFLPDRIRSEIYRYKETDFNYWRIYGLGQRGVAEATIYRNWHYAVNRQGKEIPFDSFEGRKTFGLDFGFNDPTVLIRVRYHERGGILMDQLLYKRELTSEDIIVELDKLREKGVLDYDDEIIADSSRPEIINDIKRAGYNIHPAKKEKGSVLRGINFIKKSRIFITKSSTESIKEIRGYKWKVDKDDKVLDTPVDLNDHSCDALRYALERYSRNKQEIGAV